ncbi:unnamed protein product [Amaranthus hypochondriacus]
MDAHPPKQIVEGVKDGDENDTASSDFINANTSSSQSLPEVDVKIFGKTILLNVYCEKHKGILTKLLEEVENHDINVVNCSMIPFETLALDITIVAQMEREFNQQYVNDLIRTLRSVLVAASRRES